jgi:hypothetical protein
MFREKSRKRRLQVGLLPLVLFILMWGIVACGDNGQGNVTSKPSLPRITIKAAGPILLNVTNEGAEPHQITFLKLAPGKTAQDAINYFDKQVGPAPFERAGGMSTLSTGQSAWVKLDLKPGNYAALCFVPSRTTKLPHFKMGMASSFTVQ